MTINERLFVAHLQDDWDSAIVAGNRQRAIEILGAVDLDEDGAARTVDAVLEDPPKYGYPSS